MPTFDQVSTYVKKRVANWFGYDASQNRGRAILTKCSLFKDGKFHKDLNVLPTTETPFQRWAGLHNNLSVVIEYCYKNEPMHSYRYVYDPEETITWPVPEPQLNEKHTRHPIKVFVWVKDRIPVDVSVDWAKWAGPNLNFHGKTLLLEYLVQREETQDEDMTCIAILLNDGTTTMTTTKYVTQVGWPLPLKFKNQTRQCPLNEFQFVEKLSELNLQQYQNMFAHQQNSESDTGSEISDETKSDDEENGESL